MKRAETARDLHGVQVVASSNLAAPTRETNGLRRTRRSPFSFGYTAGYTKHFLPRNLWRIGRVQTSRLRHSHTSPPNSALSLRRGKVWNVARECARIIAGLIA